LKQAIIGMLGVMPERSLDVDEELCASYIDWQKAVDCGDWILLNRY
jgi:hypothetical protein